MKSQTLFGLHLICKNQTLQNRKPDYSVFVTSTSCLIFFYLGPLMPFSTFSCFKTPWIFKSSSLTPSSVLLWNCQNRIPQFGKSDSSVFPALANLVINTATKYPTYATIPGPLHQVSYSYHDPHHCPPCAPAHHKTSKRDSPNEQAKGKTNERLGFEFKPR